MAIELKTTKATTDERHEARILWLFAHPMRMRIIRLLLDNPGKVTVQDIADRVDLAQPTVSHHMRYFEAFGLVTCRRSGLTSFYSVCPEKIREARAVLDGLLESRG